MSEYHIPVLLKQSIDALVTNPDGKYADATFGGGSHSREILSRLSPKGSLMAFDRDNDALANAPEDERLTLIHNNFRFIHNYVLFDSYEKGTENELLDGVLADLGVSSHQFDTAERGFSFRYSAALDMRMNAQQQEQGTAITARGIAVSALHTPTFIGAVLGVVCGLTGAVTWLLTTPAGTIYSGVESMITAPLNALILLAVGYDMDLSPAKIREVIKPIVFRLLIQAAAMAAAVAAVRTLFPDNREMLLAVIIYMSVPILFSAAYPVHGSVFLCL